MLFGTSSVAVDLTIFRFVTYSFDLLRGPSAGGVPDGVPSLVEVSEPVIGGAFVADLAPDTFLGIQTRLIGRQVVQVQVQMRGQELIDQPTSVPGGAVDIEVDGLAAQALTQTAQQGQKGRRVAFG